MMDRFEDDDAAYLQWLRNHPTGHVLNIAASSKYARIHKARCHALKQLSHNAGPSNPYTKTYNKICADAEDELVSENAD